MALHITTQEEVKEYYRTDRLSQSTLKGLLGGLHAFLEKQRKEPETTRSMLIGSAVDCILTGGEGQFDSEYCVLREGEGLSQQERAIVEAVHEKAPGREGLQACADEILEVANACGWQPRWKDATRVQKITEAGSGLYAALEERGGRRAISEGERRTIAQVVQSLRESPLTAAYFDRDSIGMDAHTEVHYQLPVFFKYRGLDCKALIDMLIVHFDPDTGKIAEVRPVDLKTMSGPTVDFAHSVRKYRYDIQAAWYGLAVEDWLDKQSRRHNNVSGRVSVRNFSFVVESTTSPGTPLVYQVSDSLQKMGRRGREKIRFLTGDGAATISGRIKGLDDLVTDWIFYSESDWRLDRRVAEGMDGNGVLQMDWDGIVEKAHKKGDR